MSDCEPCKNREERLNSIIPGMGNFVSGVIFVTVTSKWFLTAYMWVYGETPGERAERMGNDGTAQRIASVISDSHCKWEYDDPKEECYFAWSTERGGILVCQTHAREYDDIHAQIEEE